MAVSPTPTTNSIVGTWTSADVVPSPDGSGARLVEQAVVQFRPDNTFIEGFDLAGNAATYLGVYSLDPKSHRIAYEITSFAPPTGPAPTALNTPTLSPTVEFGNPSVLRLNNDLLFNFKNTSVSLSDFVLPPLPFSPVRGTQPSAGGGTMLPNNTPPPSIPPIVRS